MGTKHKEKKKGPKGKKARAKAKLERQWGELVDEDEQNQARIRHGKSRLLAGKQRSNKTSATTYSSASIPEHQEEVTRGTQDDDSISDEERLEHDGALDILLENIRKSEGAKKPAHDAKTGNSHMDEGMKAKYVVSEDERISLEEDGSDDDVDDGDDGDSISDDVSFGAGEATHHGVDGSFDPFANHFGYPLPEIEPQDLSCIRTSTTLKKLHTPFLIPSLELQLPDSLVELNKDDVHSEAKRRFVFNRKVLETGWKKINRSVLQHDPERMGKRNQLPGGLSSLQSVLYPSVADYQDALVTAVTRENREALHNILILHIMNHVLTSRGRIQRNNKRAKETEEMEDASVDFDTEKLRDQGYTRPSVLVLLPTRGTCLSFVEDMMNVLDDAAFVENFDRFEAEYGPPPPAEDDDETDEIRKKRRKAVLDSKGAEWQGLFGDETNDDDDFKLGISITPKSAPKMKKNSRENKTGGVSLKLYSDFYKSDIILASPLGLKMAIESGDGNGDTDFLSSIEVCAVTQSDVLLMQNWDHVNSVLELSNEQPTKNNDTDFSRVRHYLLAGKSEHWRQLIVYSRLADAHILSTFKRFSRSIEGRTKLKRRTALEDSSLCNIMVRVKQVFQRVKSRSFADQGSDRLRYFEHHVLPQIRRLKQKNTMIFIPSYFDFIAVRNLLLKKDMDFVSVTEYARVSEVSRGRARFLQGKKPIMLYTGRCHFFSRHTIKGVRHLVFFGLPEQADFFAGMVNALNLGLDEVGTDATTTCLALFTKYDAHALERIVGKSHCERMIKGEKATFMFAS